MLLTLDVRPLVLNISQYDVFGASVALIGSVFHALADSVPVVEVATRAPG
jgi:hypothetical protein